MKEIITNIELDGEVLVDIDVLTDGSYIAITDKRSVIFPFDRIELRQTFKYPIIRQLTDNSFLVADSITKKNLDNCFIYDKKGNALGQFLVGDGIQDIEVLGNRIVVTYFDEGVYGTDGPNNEGLVLFDFAGKILFGYNEKHAPEIISDCYCICKHGANRVVFLPYSEFQLVELNVDSGEEKEYEIPEEVKGSSGLTSIADSFIFHSPYEDKRGLYKWRAGDKNAEKIGEYSEGLRGLENGRFLAKGEKGFTILDLN